MFIPAERSLNRYLILWVLMATGAIAWTPATGQERESQLRRKLAWQIALDNIGYAPGLIDGNIGAKTNLATQEFQRVHGLPITGQLDEATAKALKIDPDRILGRYTIQAEDLAEIGPVPKTWLAKSQLNRLGHEALQDVLAEKFHCATHLLATLNPGRNINSLKPGDKVVVPILEEPADYPQASSLEVNLTEKTIRVINAQKQLAALFPCSIAADKANLPNRDARVAVIAPNPEYTFDPKMWTDVKENITQKLTIPAGPRNPVGRCWIGLNLPGYGIHGTPNPELIGKTGSHGCFRLANWDAIRLSKMVQVGTPVHFVQRPPTTVAMRNKR